MPAPDTAPVERFLDAVVQRDFVACSRCLADDIVFKALLPDAHHDVSSAREAAWLLTHWFDDAREIEVLELLVKGFAYKEVAGELTVSYSTVQRHIESIYRKLHVHSRTHAVSKYLGA